MSQQFSNILSKRTTSNKFGSTEPYVNTSNDERLNNYSFLKEEENCKIDEVSNSEIDELY